MSTRLLLKVALAIWLNLIVGAACAINVQAPKCEPVKVTVPPSPAPGASPYCVV